MTAEGHARRAAVQGLELQVAKHAEAVDNLSSMSSEEAALVSERARETARSAEELGAHSVAQAAHTVADRAEKGKAKSSDGP